MKMPMHEPSFCRNVHKPLSVSLILTIMLVVDCIGVSYLLNVHSRPKVKIKYIINFHAITSVP